MSDLNRDKESLSSESFAGGKLQAERFKDFLLRQANQQSLKSTEAIQTELGKKDSVVHDLTDSHKRNFDQKIYMFPESYNQLRRELYEHWPNLWAVVGWYMAHSAWEFVEAMNFALDMALIIDSEKVDEICTAYLKELRKLRGLKS